MDDSGVVHPDDPSGARSSAKTISAGGMSFGSPQDPVVDPQIISSHLAICNTYHRRKFRNL